MFGGGLGGLGCCGGLLRVGFAGGCGGWGGCGRGGGGMFAPSQRILPLKGGGWSAARYLAVSEAEGKLPDPQPDD